MKDTGCPFGRMSLSLLVWYFLMIRFGLNLVDRYTTEVLFQSLLNQSAIGGGLCCLKFLSLWWSLSILVGHLCTHSYLYLWGVFPPVKLLWLSVLCVFRSFGMFCQTAFQKGCASSRSLHNEWKWWLLDFANTGSKQFKTSFQQPPLLTLICLLFRFLECVTGWSQEPRSCLKAGLACFTHLCGLPRYLTRLSA